MFGFAAWRVAILAAILVACSLAAGTDPARAQTIIVQKDLCGPALGGSGADCVVGNGSALPVVTPYTPASYTITLTYTGAGSTSVNLADTFPAGFHPVPTATCDGNPISLGSGTPAALNASLALTSGTNVVCVVPGYFEYLPASPNNANNMATVYAQGNSTTPLATSNLLNAAIGSPSTVPSDLSVVKTAQVTSTGNGTATIDYTITITNNGQTAIYGLHLQDRVSLPASSIPMIVTYQNNAACSTNVVNSANPATSGCFDANPNPSNSPVVIPTTTPVDFAEWGYPASGNQMLAPNESMVFTYSVTVAVPTGLDCERDPLGNGLINEAHIGFDVPGATTTVFEAAPGNNTGSNTELISYAATLDPNCGHAALQITKELFPATPSSFTWPATVNYKVSLHNLSNLPLTNIQLFDSIGGNLGDFVSPGVGTPAFTAEVAGVSCLTWICATTTQAAGSQAVAGYLNPHWMLGTTVVSVAPHASVSFQLKIRYSKPECDSDPAVQQKPVLNFVRARYADPTLGGGIVTLQSAPVTVMFNAPAPCKFEVTKHVTDGSQKIIFGQNVHYVVTYRNDGAAPVTIGTLIDALQIQQADYASPLTVHYDYTCATADGVSGFSSIGGPFPFSQSGVVQVVHTVLPQQGVRIIQNAAPVLFPPDSSLTCAVRIRVDRPSSGAAQCARSGTLQNTAIMDQSAFYNSNLPWNDTGPGYAGTVSLPLPACFDLVINKDAHPGWVTETGGPITYRITVSNLGDPIQSSDGVYVRDLFQSTSPSSVPPNLGMTVSGALCLFGSYYSFPVSSIPGPTNCDTGWATPPTQNPSLLKITTLSTNWAAAALFQVPGGYPATDTRMCNHAVVSLDGLIKEGDWYQKDPATWKTDLCVPVLKTGKLTIRKTLTYDTYNYGLQDRGDFQVTVSCTGPDVALQIINLKFSDGYQETVPVDLPAGAVCTVTEVLPQMPSGIPPGSQWIATPSAVQHVTIESGYQTLTLNNERVNYITAPGQSELVVVKTFAIRGTIDPNHTMSFPIEVACHDSLGVPVPGPWASFTLTPNATSYLLGNAEANYDATIHFAVPTGSTCTVSEPTLPALSPSLANCHWVTAANPYLNIPYGGNAQPGASVDLAVPQRTYGLRVTNELHCP